MNARLLLAALLLFTASALAAAAPDDEKDPIKEKLFAAKVAYDKEMQDYRKQAGEWFDKREEVARKDGNKKLVDQLKVEREAFDGSGELPKAAPAALRQKSVAARKALEAAHTQAVKDYVRAKKDVEAAAVEEAWKEFTTKAPAAPVEGAAVVIACAVSNKVLGLHRGSTDEGTKVVTADYAKGDEKQLWKIVPAGDGWVYVENVKSGLVMTADGKGNGTEVVIAKKAQPASENQLWKVTPVPNVKDAVRVFAKPSGKLIGVDAKSKDAGARILLWSEQGTEPAQLFGFTPPK